MSEHPQYPARFTWNDCSAWRLPWEAQGNVSRFEDFGGIHTCRGRKAHAFWCKVQGRNAGVNPGIAAAMAH